ncbi:hypothetical protein BN1184_BM_00430 [Pantoea ananatis]|nr:hypothetical protein BN1184_BM_00430 [Pantoea ananatis]
MSYRPGIHVHTEKYGASGRIRTSDRSVRSRVLYPAELRMHRKAFMDWQKINLRVIRRMVHPGG